MSKPSDLLARLVFNLRWTWHTPDVYHLNEGHSALVAVERAAERVRTARESDFFTAHHHIAQSTAFTTHTPVLAGHDRSSADLVEAHLAPYREQIGLSREEFMALGRRDPSDRGEAFSMTVLALRSAYARNAVSRLHAHVSRKLWSGIGVGLRNVQPSVQMESITNGVHTGTRTAQRARLLERVDAAARGQGAPGLCPSITADRALVLGFARRFATYKRAGLLLQNAERLARLLNDAARYSGRLMFLVDYDVDLARLLVQGSDIWLNTPRRLQEASGTTGMKATHRMLDEYVARIYTPLALGGASPLSYLGNGRLDTVAA